MDLKRQKFEAKIGDRDLVMEVSNLAGQTNASVTGYLGGTVIMAHVVMGREDRDTDYFPLTVDFEEKFYSVGKILGSRFFRREGRSSTKATLSSRLIDRAIRPLFDHNLRRDVQVIVDLISLEEGSDPILLGLLTASTAIAISDIPWNGPVGAALIKKDNWGAFVTGTSDKINMIEMDGLDVSEKEVIAEFEKAQKEIARLIEFQNSVVKKIGKKKAAVHLAQPDEDLRKKVGEFLKNKLEGAIYTSKKTERECNLEDLNADLHDKLIADGFDGSALKTADLLVHEETDKLVHKNIIESNKRPDGRKLDEVRELGVEVGVFERLHGSALFIRGTTQALGVVTLGTPDSEMLVESPLYIGPKRFFLHYNFPPFSTGETGKMRGPGRREIGHGALAEKALESVIPNKEEFPYTVRIVSEILSSNGSSSMASVCAGCMALMDAGVPIKKMVTGIAMGLMSDDKGNYKILTDIQGPEDHHGDMDFKVAGTEDGVNAIQLDVKIDGVTPKIAGEVLEQAKKARLEILAAMKKVLAAPRKELSKYAPIVAKMDINPEKIGEVIGPGGKTINSIIETTGVENIDIEQTGRVYVFGPSQEKVDKALKAIEVIVKEYAVGEVVEGTITKILDFGAVLEFAPGRDGLIHVSELREGFVKKVTDVLKEGDFARAKIIRIENGKYSLSLKALQKQS